MMQHASRRVIPTPTADYQPEEAFDSDDFFTNEPMIPLPPEADEEIGTGFEFAKNEGSFKRSALKLLGIR